MCASHHRNLSKSLRWHQKCVNDTSPKVYVGIRNLLMTPHKPESSDRGYLAPSLNTYNHSLLHDSRLSAVCCVPSVPFLTPHVLEVKHQHFKSLHTPEAVH